MSRPSLGRGLAVALVAISLALLGASPAAAQSAGSGGDFYGRIEIPGGRQMYLECHGSGSPVVIFEAGLRGRDDVWFWADQGGYGAGVLPRVSPFTRTCIYDRPGTLAHYPYVSRSDPVPMPRSTGEVVADLHALLTAAGVPGPYVMVGASTGGLIARQYASLYPAEVSGVVLVDAISEAMQELMSRGQFARYNAYYLQSPGEDARKYDHLEAIDFYRSFAEMKPRRRTPRRLPTVVISADYGFGTPQGVWRGFAELVNRTWKRSQLYLAALHPKTKRVIARGSGHQIHVNRPGLVARYVLRMVARARGF